MADEFVPTSSIVARHGIAWMGGGSGGEVYGCRISGAWHIGHPRPGKSRDDYRKEAR